MKPPGVSKLQKKETDSDDEDAPLALARHRHKKVAKRAQEVKEEEDDEGGALTFNHERLSSLQKFVAFKTNRQRELKELFGDAATDNFITKTISRHAQILTLCIYPQGEIKGGPELELFNKRKSMIAIVVFTGIQTQGR